MDSFKTLCFKNRPLILPSFAQVVLCCMFCICCLFSSYSFPLLLSPLFSPSPFLSLSLSLSSLFPRIWPGYGKKPLSFFLTPTQLSAISLIFRIVLNAVCASAIFFLPIKVVCLGEQAACIEKHSLLLQEPFC